ncbi:MAG: hypothetical protein JOS17DRAFT_789663 [Linnemannia elongata]|nr:MAG: hypothetical protein JOS17DRAFT_789663 [Linnemannia elongata]
MEYTTPKGYDGADAGEHPDDGCDSGMWYSSGDGHTLHDDEEYMEDDDEDGEDYGEGDEDADDDGGDDDGY